ncbi:MAG: leucine-rich repeat domain-containing protein [Bacteroidales bacterium]|nr:leucine-rich repeat domain-containing protein [Bacteroidales bacterium]
MKKLFLVVIAFLFAINFSSKAEDFSAVNNGGTIYYKITSNVYPYTASVTYKNGTQDSYSGNISIPDSVSYNGHYYKVTSIGDQAFLCCDALFSIYIPKSVTSIGVQAFYQCYSINSINIPNSVTSIGKLAFSQCVNLTSVTIPNSVTLIKEGSFMNCSKLGSITIPNSITSIECNAFANCYELASIVIGSYVDSIGFWAFYNCRELTSIRCLATTPPVLGSEVFQNVDTTINLFVPTASIPLYQEAYGWEDFYNIHSLKLNDIASTKNVEVLIYPNPAKDMAKIEFDNLDSKANIIVLDILGKEVKREVIAKGTKEIEINVSNLPKGIYNILIVNDTINQTKKLVVSK